MRQRFINNFLAAALFFPVMSHAAELTTEKQQFSYAIGVNLAGFLQQQGINEVETEAFAAGVEDVLQGKSLQLDVATMKTAIENQQKKILEQEQQAADATKQKGKEFLEKNKAVKGVKVLDNGLQYIVLKTGTGKQPDADSTVTVHYHGTLIDGTVFDSSVERGEPASFGLSRVIPGFRESLVRMKTGGKWRVFVPSELGYGETGAGGKIGPNETLIFEIELLEVK